MINLKKINLRSIILNFYLLPFKQAIKFPISIESHVLIKELHRGAVILEGNIIPGMLQIGYNIVGIVDEKRDRGIIHISRGGKLICKGKTFIGTGCNISIGKTAEIIFGKDAVITAKSSLICHKKIMIGENFLCSWDVLIMDTDFHKIYSESMLVNEPKEIIIGDKVWICCGCKILKGSKVPNGCVIGANSFLNKEFYRDNSVYVGNPARLYKEGISWEI